jgi:hypothetical protein
VRRFAGGMAFRLIVLCCLASLALRCGVAVGAAGPRVDYYVRNVKVPEPCVRAREDVFVPPETLLRLYSGAFTNIGTDASGLLLVNGQATAAHVLMRGQSPWYPVLAVARFLKWDIQTHLDLGIVDVVSPLKNRLTSAKAGDLPVDPREKEAAERGSRKLQSIYGPIYHDERLTAKINAIGHSLAAASGRPGINWQFFVLDSKELQACSVGLGYVYVTRGLLALLDDNELAGVLAHEIAHGTMRHATRANDMNDLYKYYVAKAREAHQRQQAISAERGGNSDMTRFRVAEAAREEQENTRKANEIAQRLKNWVGNESWDLEFEADRLGMLYAHNAGYHPMGLIDALHKLEAAQNEHDPDLQAVETLQTHPPIADRVRIAQRAYATFFGNQPASGQ